jgi:hypothetical protein
MVKTNSVLEIHWMRIKRRCLFNIFFFVVPILILIAYGFQISNISQMWKIEINDWKLNSQLTIPSLFLRYVRSLYPQIWACQATNFKGEKGYYSQLGEDETLHKWIFNNTEKDQNPGIFVEIGALDGVTYSNTLFFERMFDWRGVLIEAQPENARRLLRVNRRNTVKLPFGICSPPQTHIRMLVSFQHSEHFSYS